MNPLKKRIKQLCETVHELVRSMKRYDLQELAIRFRQLHPFSIGLLRHHVMPRGFPQ
jgi:hypothetical protein